MLSNVKKWECCEVLFIWEAERDVCRDGMIFFSAFKTVYMGGGTGIYPGMGRFSSHVYM